MLGPWLSESAEPVERVECEVDAQPIPEIVALRIAAKYEIARDVIAGKLSLFQGAALFGALNQVPPQAPRLSSLGVRERSLGVPARTEEEQLCSQVANYVRLQLAEEPEQAEAALARLKGDFKQKLRTEGSIRLPDSSSLVSVQELFQQARADLTDKGVIAREGMSARRDRKGGRAEMAPFSGRAPPVRCLRPASNSRVDRGRGHRKGLGERGCVSAPRLGALTQPRSLIRDNQ
jgi:hypothetical protein